jgi:hypothetical protein
VQSYTNSHARQTAEENSNEGDLLSFNGCMDTESDLVMCLAELESKQELCRTKAGEKCSSPDHISSVTRQDVEVTRHNMT